MALYKFNAEINIIGVNPFVFVPPEILTAIFKKADREKGPIPVHGTVNGMPYQQNLVKYLGEWRLYINTTMLKNSPKRIGETIRLTIAHDEKDRSIAMPPRLSKALAGNPAARTVFEGLRPSLQHEIIRYIARLKTDQSVEKNVSRAIAFLLGRERFIGRDKP